MPHSEIDEQLSLLQRAAEHGVHYIGDKCIELFDCDLTDRQQRVRFHVSEDGTMEIVTLNGPKEGEAGEPTEVFQLNEVQVCALLGKILGVTKMHVTGIDEEPETD